MSGGEGGVGAGLTRSNAARVSLPAGHFCSPRGGGHLHRARTVSTISLGNGPVSPIACEQPHKHRPTQPHTSTRCSRLGGSPCAHSTAHAGRRLRLPGPRPPQCRGLPLPRLALGPLIHASWPVATALCDLVGRASGWAPRGGSRTGGVDLLTLHLFDSPRAALPEKWGKMENCQKCIMENVCTGPVRIKQTSLPKDFLQPRSPVYTGCWVSSVRIPAVVSRSSQRILIANGQGSKDSLFVVTPHPTVITG